MSPTDESDSPSPCGRGPGGGEAATRLLHARSMRRSPTRAERMLWRSLRAGQIDGLKFRRQTPIGLFIADFFCPSARLVIEVDGITHDDPRRDAWMRQQGLRVLRVWDDDVIWNRDGVLQIVRAIALRPLPPTPSRKGRGSRSRRADA